MKIEFEGKVYDFDLDDLNSDEAKTIKDHYGLNLGDFTRSIFDSDPDAIIGAYWLMRRQNGEPDLAPENVKSFKIVTFLSAFADGVAAQVKEQEEKDKVEAEKRVESGEEAVAVVIPAAAKRGRPAKTDK
jgi:hypothetical protein